MAMNRKAAWVLTLLLVSCVNRAEAQQQPSNIPEIGLLRVDASTSPAAIEIDYQLETGIDQLGVRGRAERYVRDPLGPIISSIAFRFSHRSWSSSKWTSS